MATTEATDTRAAIDAAAASRLAAAGLVAAAAGVAAYSQYLTTRTLPRTLEGLDFLQRWFAVYRTDAPRISTVMALFVLAGVLMGIAANLNLRDEEPTGEARGLDALGTLRAFTGGTGIPSLLWLLAAAGVGLWSIFLLHLHDKQYTHALNGVLGIALVLVLAPLVSRDLRAQGRAWRRPGRQAAFDIALVFAVALVFIWLNARDLGSWKYSAIGDEYNNFYYGLGIAEGTIPWNPWSHVGADKIAAVAASAGQALVMRLGDGDNFSWRFYAVLLMAATLIPYYFLLLEMFSRRVAVIATVLLAASHYIFAYTHHGLYIDGILPTVLGLLALLVGIRLNSVALLFVSGAMLALGFYAFETGRAGVIIVSIFMLSFGPRSLRPPVVLPMAAGFIMLALPLFATDGFRQVFDQMFDQSAVSYSSTITGSRWERFQDNVQFTMVSFNYSTQGRHYVWGSLADPVTAALMPLGVGVALFNVVRPAYRLLLIWWLVAIAVGGFTNPYPTVPMTRLQYAVPAVAGLAALAVDHGIRAFVALLEGAGGPLARLRVAWGPLISVVVVAGVLASAISLNLYRFWDETPRRYGAPTVEAVVMRAYQEGGCEGKPVTVVGVNPLALLEKVMRSYQVSPTPVYVYWEHLTPALANGWQIDLGRPACVIVQHDVAQEQLMPALAQLPHRLPGLGPPQKITDERGARVVYLMRTADAFGAR